MVTVTGNGKRNEAQPPMKYTLGKAAEATDKSKTTIHRAITSGKLSAMRNEQGEYEIDPSELLRVYDIVTPEPQKRNEMERSVTPVMVDEAAVLSGALEGLEPQLGMIKDEPGDPTR